MDIYAKFFVALLLFVFRVFNELLEWCYMFAGAAIFA